MNPRPECRMGLGVMRRIEVGRWGVLEIVRPFLKCSVVPMMRTIQRQIIGHNMVPQFKKTVQAVPVFLANWTMCLQHCSQNPGCLSS